MLICNPTNRYWGLGIRLLTGVILLTSIGPISAQPLESSGLKAKGATSSAELLLEETQRDPTVAAILALPRKTPIDTLVAVFTLLDLGKQPMAAKLLAPLLQRQLTPAEQSNLVTHFGSAKFLQLSRISLAEGKIPTSGDSANGSLFEGVHQFAANCLKAAADRNLDPKRIASLVTQLHDPQAEQRLAARVDLQTTGTTGVVACLQALATLDTESTTEADHQDQRTHLMTALVDLHPATDVPLLAMLSSCSNSGGRNGLLTRDLAEVAGHLRIPSAIPWLAKLVACAPDSRAYPIARQALAEMGISPPTSGAVRSLVLHKMNLLQEVGLTAEQNPILWWRWSPGKSQLTAHEYSSAQLNTLTLARLSSLLVSCGNPSPSEQRLALIYALEGLPLNEDSRQIADTQIDHGQLPLGEHLAKSLHIDSLHLDSLHLDQWSVDQWSATLSEAIKRERLNAAMRVIRILGQLGDKGALASSRGRPAPLVRTLRHPHPELRFTALSTVMELAPEKSFAGSSYLPEALWDFSLGNGAPIALVLSSRAKRRNTWAGQLREFAYEAIPVATGREALQVAGQSSRLALILADAQASRPTVREVHYQLRASTQAGHVPMAIVCGSEQLLKFDRLTAKDPLLLVAMRPTQKSRFQEMVVQLQRLANPPFAPDTVRLQRAEQALNWLTQLLQLQSSAQGNLFHELRRNGHIAETTLSQPNLAVASLHLLEQLGTADSQLTLLDYASGKNLPLDSRQIAAKRFASSVNQYGILMTTDQIRSQYDRYNASQFEDRETQQVLGKLLDVLESDQ
ncbi:MAG: hypothetical protein ABGX16_08260 [Pirellulales bacterium]